MFENTAEIRVGRLLEVRSLGGYRTTGDVDAFFENCMRRIAGLPPGERVVTIVDHRRCPIMAPEAASHFSARLAVVNYRTIRSAALVSADSPSVMLQYGRVIKDSQYEQRRLFTDEDAAIGWLSQVLTAEETQRLSTFVRQGEPVKPTGGVRFLGAELAMSANPRSRRARP